MLTSKPFSTISYNTDSFLTAKLDDILKRRKIYFYAFINHLPEDDEAKKPHKHLLIIPNGKTDADAIIDYLSTEFDPTNPTKPLGCIFPKSSKISDWLLYAIHDVDYLASKGQSRQYHYTFDDIVRSDDDTFTEFIHSIDYTPFKRFKMLRKAAEDGVPFSALVSQGIIPLQAVSAFEKGYYLIRENATFRDDRLTHTPLDPEVEVFKKHPRLMPCKDDAPEDI